MEFNGSTIEDKLTTEQGGEVWTGFHDAGQWRFVSADPINEPVLHWMPFPNPPEL